MSMIEYVFSGSSISDGVSSHSFFYIDIEFFYIPSYFLNSI